MRVYKIKVNGKKYEVTVMGISEVEPTVVEKVKKETNVEVKEEVKEAPLNSEVEKILSPMQGTILNIKVKVGDIVKKGDNLLILEAMKLENEIKSTVDGKFVEIRVNKGQQVNSKDILVVIQ